ncbi:MAG: Rrf2 family transcriptional regulator [bacterium]|nr:Rrf2 family transcriptional regulator [bacterium]
MFSKACEYGIRASIYISLQSLNDNRASLKDISAEIGSPEAFTAKILQQLVRNNIITSVKGAMGGFEIGLKQMNRIRLEEIILAIDEGFTYKTCVLGLRECSQKNPCPVHHKFKHIKADLKTMLQDTTLFEMSTGLKEGLTCLKL